MNEPFRQHYAAVKRWHERGHAAGWLGNGDLRALERLESASPDDLFEDGQTRPLVVALFGGTGVGKSSLLNRLAGEPIARTGIERPTSLEVTAYLHESIALGRMPDDLPLERLRVARHRDEQRQDLMWVDMPDIDSTEADNRALAMAWLPHTDLLVYVVSPERYRDDVGWRVLLQRRHRHGWLFVMNHWDQGGEAQVEDLAAILHEAGFSEPVILRTCCSPPACAARDELPRLVQAIDDLRDSHRRRELERLGHAARLRDLQSVLRDALARLGSAEQWRGFQAELLDAVTRARAEILEGMQWPIRDLAASLAPERRSLMGRLLGPATSPPADKSSQEEPEQAWRKQVAETVWDPWAARKLDETVDALELAMRRDAVSASPLIDALRQCTQGAEDAIVDKALFRLRRALARPGGRLRRSFHLVTGMATVLLPAAALAWVALHVVRAFYRGVSEQGAFLGTDFAINAVLLVLVAWLLPFLLHRLLAPSVEKAAEAALRGGIDEGLGRIIGEMTAECDRLGAERESLCAEAEGLAARLAADSAERPSRDPAVTRLLSASSR